MCVCVFIFLGAQNNLKMNGKKRVSSSIEPTFIPSPNLNFRKQGRLDALATELPAVSIHTVLQERTKTTAVSHDSLIHQFIKTLDQIERQQRIIQRHKKIREIYKRFT